LENFIAHWNVMLIVSKTIKKSMETVWFLLSMKKTKSLVFGCLHSNMNQS
jgi:hypothetical protein